MRTKHTFLRSRVGRRILGLFVLCALLPLAVLTVVSFLQVGGNLREQSGNRLRQASRALGMTVMERLVLLENNLKVCASYLRAGRLDESLVDLEPIIENRFSGLAIFSPRASVLWRSGHPIDRYSFSDEELSHLRSGKPLLVNRSDNQGTHQMLLATLVDSTDPSQGYIVGEINPAYLWQATTEVLPHAINLCVLDEYQHPLFSTHAVTPTFLSLVPVDARSAHTAEIKWRDDEGQFTGRYRSLYLRPAFYADHWTIVVSERNADVFAPLARFKQTFLLVVLITFWVVVLLSLTQIRSSMMPLQRLDDATKRVADGDFDFRVDVRSRDEFGDLAASFNSMAEQIGRQVSTLAAIAEIDRAILSALDDKAIVKALAARVGDVVSCDGVIVCLEDTRQENTLRIYRPGGHMVEVASFTADEQALLVREAEAFVVGPDTDVPRYVRAMADDGIQLMLVLPVIAGDKPAGVVGIGRSDASAVFNSGDIRWGRQLADQVAVAFSNTRLISKLDRFGWGTLTALARAIDAKSPWTLGHSERVTHLAVEIGRVLGISKEQIHALRRGGLIHDIGKIGVPRSILDKKGSLTREETEVVRDHVRIGVNILEPIGAFADVMPIVAQHHEHYNGTGYPAGLAGEEIDLLARIFTVADYFDALTNERPYRKAMARAAAITIITEGAEREFDPRVVEALLTVLANAGGRPASLEEESERLMGVTDERDRA